MDCNLRRQIISQCSHCPIRSCVLYILNKTKFNSDVEITLMHKLGRLELRGGSSDITCKHNSLILFRCVSSIYFDYSSPLNSFFFSIHLLFPSPGNVATFHRLLEFRVLLKLLKPNKPNFGFPFVSIIRSSTTSTREGSSKCSGTYPDFFSFFFR